MEHYLIENVQDLAKSAYLYSLAIFIALELLTPKRINSESIALRWINNFLIAYTNGYLARLLFPLSFLSFAVYLQDSGIGLLNQLSFPLWVEVVIGILLLDLGGYGLHRATHRVQLLWRFHLIHHTDPEINFTTAVRHHPVEMIIGHLFFLSLYYAIGFSPAAVAGFALLTTITPFFNHANIQIPFKLDAYLRKVIVTPDVHRIHHSSYQPETDSNYGEVFTWWDRLFGTYTATPKLGHAGMTIGIEGYSGKSDQYIHRLWWLPFIYKSPSKSSPQVPEPVAKEP